MKILKLLFCYVLLFVSTWNVYSMEAEEIKKPRTSTDVSVNRTVESQEDAAGKALASALETLAKFPIRSENFINLLHTWASNAEVAYLQAAFGRYRDLKVAECNNRFDETLLDSANKAPEDLANKSKCIAFLSALTADTSDLGVGKGHLHLRRVITLGPEDLLDILDIADDGGCAGQIQ